MSHRITPAQREIIDALRQNREPLSVCRLTSMLGHLGSARSAVRRSLNLLEEAKLVRLVEQDRHSSAFDTYQLTDTGESA